MSGSTGRAAAQDYSRGSGAPGAPRDGGRRASGGPPPGVRRAAAALAAAGALALVAAVALPVVSYDAPAATAGLDRSVSGWERSGPLLALVGLAALAAAPAVARGARVGAAAAGWLAAGALVVLLSLARDAGRLDDVLTVGIGGPEGGVEATAGPGAGWYTQTGGAVALLAAGGALLLWRWAAGGRPRPDRAGPTAGRPTARLDWFGDGADR